MSTPPRRTSSLGIYHIIFRGVNKQRVFEDNEDYDRFLQTLRRFQPKCGYKLLAYCLMSNHIHLLIKPGKMNTAQIIMRVCPSFVYWYNAKYQRIGHLFQARYKSSAINNTGQLFKVIRYIHRNPVNAGICGAPEEYQYSSFHDYFDNDLIDADIILSFISKEAFINFNHMDNCGDQCMDIEDEVPRRAFSDERVKEIMREVCGCKNVAEFQALSVEQRNAALRSMLRFGASIKQINRVTGVSSGVIKRVLHGGI